MACLGGDGTPEDRRTWYNGHGEERHGRVCRWRSKRTSVARCSTCQAYRGPDGHGGRIGALYANEDPHNFTALEMELYLDDPELWFARVSRDLAPITLAMFASFRELDDELAEIMRAYFREWRAKHPGYDKRQGRKRDRAAYMRAYRARQRNPANCPTAED